MAAKLKAAVSNIRYTPFEHPSQWNNIRLHQDFRIKHRHNSKFQTKALNPKMHNIFQDNSTSCFKYFLTWRLHIHLSLKYLPTNNVLIVSIITVTYSASMYLFTDTQCVYTFATHSAFVYESLPTEHLSIFLLTHSMMAYTNICQRTACEL